MTVRDEHRLRVYEHRALRDEVTGEWKRLHNKELCDLYSSPHIIQVIKSIRMRLTGHVACMGDRRGFGAET
jgi:hypothetical protein